MLSNLDPYTVLLIGIVIGVVVTSIVVALVMRDEDLDVDWVICPRGDK